MNKVELKPGERLDDLQRCGFQIIQSDASFCFGMDAVLLAAFAGAKEGDHVLDLGTGTGVIPLLMRARTPGTTYEALEINPVSADMAERSVRYNQMEEDIHVIRGDLKEVHTLLKAGSYDVVTSNPPYMIGGHGLVGADEGKAGARHEIWCTLDDVTRQAAKMLKPGGRFCMVHRPFRLAEIIRSLSAHGLEPKRMRLVYPFADREPNMVLIESVRGGRPRMTVEKPLIVYEAQGVYTQEILDLYRE
ncbi:MAG: tRNA1(Val) (adenine(37)-N6)-methyltransferase [Lachnospiraceae bacterium]|nr:tRNA1(Val) (adenine(37)-N6)-methyltransferase [Lachnospiraceae bacterium]